MQLIKDNDLADLLTNAEADDLGILIDLITDSGNGRFSLSSEVCSKLTSAKNSNKVDPECRALIVEELRRFGGNSLANFLRGGDGISYKEIASDVAKRVKAPHNAQHDCLTIEAAIIAKVMEKSLEKMTEAERTTFFDSVGQTYIPGSGPAAIAGLLSLVSSTGILQMSAYIANATASAMIGRGLAYGASAFAPNTAAALAGPIGWALAAIWTAYDLSSPAYRVTVPCVIQIAYMRRKTLQNPCIQCGAHLPAAAKFCSECGQPQAEKPKFLKANR